jgi:uncharacterized protein YlaI
MGKKLPPVTLKLRRNQTKPHRIFYCTDTSNRLAASVEKIN